MANNLVKNVLKSAKYGALGVGKNLMPETFDAAINIAPPVKDFIRTFKKADRTQKKILNRFWDNEEVKHWTSKSEELLKNAYEDFSTGNLYNKSREEEMVEEFMMDGEDEDFGSFMDDDFDFGDSDDDFDSDDDDENQSDTIVKKNNIKKSYNVNNVVKKTVNMNSEPSSKLSNSVVVDPTTGNIVGSHIKRLSSLQMVMSDREVDVLQNISTNIEKVVEFNSTAMSKMFEQTTVFHASVAGMMGEISSNIGDLIELNKERDKALGIFKEDKGYEYEDEVLDDFGGFSLSNYIKSKKSQGQGKVGGIYDDLKFMMDTLVANPIGTIMEEAFTKMLPEGFKEITRDFNEMVTNIPLLFFNKMDEWAKEGTGMFSWIGKFLGIDMGTSRDLKLGEFDKGPVPFDGTTKRAIVNIIPGYLSRILKAVSGDDDRLLYNMEKGQFEKESDVQKRFDTDVSAGYGDFSKHKMGLMEQYMEENDLESMDSDASNIIKEDFDKVFENIVRNNTGLFQGEDLSEEFLETLPEDVRGPIKSYFNNLSDTELGSLQRDIFKHKKGEAGRYKEQGQKYDVQMLKDMVSSKEGRTSKKEDPDVKIVRKDDEDKGKIEASITELQKLKEEGIDVEKYLQRRKEEKEFKQRKETKEGREALETDPIWESDKKGISGFLSNLYNAPFKIMSRGMKKFNTKVIDIFFGREGEKDEKGLFGTAKDKFNKFMFGDEDAIGPDGEPIGSEGLLGKVRKPFDFAIGKFRNFLFGGGDFELGLFNKVGNFFDDKIFNPFKSFLFGSRTDILDDAGNVIGTTFGDDGILLPIKNKLNDIKDYFSNALFGEGGFTFLGKEFDTGIVPFIKDKFSGFTDYFSNMVFGEEGFSFLGQDFDQGIVPFIKDKFSVVTDYFSDVLFGEGGFSFLGQEFDQGIVPFIKGKFEVVTDYFSNILFSEEGISFLGEEFSQGLVPYLKDKFSVVTDKLSDVVFGEEGFTFLGQEFSQGLVPFFKDKFSVVTDKVSEIIFGEEGFTFLGQEFSQGLVPNIKDGFENVKNKFSIFLFGDKDNLDDDGNIIDKGILDPIKKGFNRAKESFNKFLFGSTENILDDDGNIIDTKVTTGVFTNLKQSMQRLADSAGEFLFGDIERDKDGNIISEGLFSGLKRVFDESIWDPFKGMVSAEFENLKSFWNESVVEPLRGTFEPFVTEFKYQVGRIPGLLRSGLDIVKSGIDEIFETAFGKPLTVMLQENVVDPLRNLLGSFKDLLKNITGNLIKGAVGIFKGVSERIRESQIRRGIIDGDTDSPGFLRRVINRAREKNADRIKAKEDKEREKISKKAKNALKIDKKDTPIMTTVKSGFSKLADLFKSDNDKSDKQIEVGKESNSLLKNISTNIVNFFNKVKPDFKGKGVEKPKVDTPDIEKPKTKSPIDFVRENTERLKDVMAKIRDFIKDNLNGVGYNVNKIAKMIERSLGFTDGEEFDPENRKYRSFYQKLLDKVTAPFKFIGKGIRKVKNKIVEMITSPFKLIKKAATVAKDAVVKTITAAKDAVVGTVKFVRDSVKAFMDGIFGIIKGVFKGVGHLATGLGALGGEILRAGGKVVNGIADIISSAGPYIGDLIGRAFSKIGEVAGALTDVFLGVLDITVQFGEALFEVTKFVGKKLFGVFKGLVNAVGSFARIINPFKKKSGKGKTKSDDLTRVYVEDGQLGNIGTVDLIKKIEVVELLKTADLIKDIAGGKLDTIGEVEKAKVDIEKNNDEKSISDPYNLFGSKDDDSDDDSISSKASKAFPSVFGVGKKKKSKGETYKDIRKSQENQEDEIEEEEHRGFLRGGITKIVNAIAGKDGFSLLNLLGIVGTGVMGLAGMFGNLFGISTGVMSSALGSFGLAGVGGGTLVAGFNIWRDFKDARDEDKGILGTIKHTLIGDPGDTEEELQANIKRQGMKWAGIGSVIGSMVLGSPVGAIVGGILGYFLGKVFGRGLDPEDAGDEFKPDYTKDTDPSLFSNNITNEYSELEGKTADELIKMENKLRRQAGQDPISEEKEKIIRERYKRNQDIRELHNQLPNVMNNSNTVTDFFLQSIPGSRVTQEYKKGGKHKGIDIGGKGVLGKPIPSPVSGKVLHNLDEERGGDFGNVVAVQDSSGFVHVFAHLKESNLQVGENIGIGDPIGLLGNSGNSSGPHLHYQIDKPDTRLDGTSYVGNPNNYAFNKANSFLSQNSSIYRDSKDYSSGQTVAKNESWSVNPKAKDNNVEIERTENQGGGKIDLNIGFKEDTIKHQVASGLSKELRTGGAGTNDLLSKVVEVLLEISETNREIAEKDTNISIENKIEEPKNNNNNEDKDDDSDDPRMMDRGNFFTSKVKQNNDDNFNIDENIKQIARGV